MGKRNLVRRMCLDGMLGALYVVLIVCTIRIGTFRITIASLPVVFAAIAFGIPDAVCIALLGEFIMQVMQYGLTVTTPLWIIPPVFRALTVGLFSLYFKKRHENLDRHYVMFFVALIIGAIVTTGSNTFAMWIDSIVFSYRASYILVDLPLRLAMALASAIAVGAICIPLMNSLRKGKFIPDYSLPPKQE